MSTMGKEPRLKRTIALALVAAGIGGSSSVIIAQSNDAQVQWQGAAGRIDALGTVDARVMNGIEQWRRLQATGTTPANFAAISSFMLSYPGWPSEDSLRNQAEQSVDPTKDSAASITAFFGRFPARTATGRARHAQVLADSGQTEAAVQMARSAWVTGSMPAADESALLARFGTRFTADEHLRRADRLLWSRNATGAERVLAFVAPTRQPIIAARIAFQRRADDAALRMGAADAIGSGDAGYLADKAGWLRASGNIASARRLLASRPALISPPADPEEWLEVLLREAKSAVADGDHASAFAIASRVDDALPAGTVLRDQSLGVRDDYTSLTWLAGMTALDQLARPAQAEAMFTRYANGGRAPSTIAKGHYWAGRAALSAGRSETAMNHFANAGALGDQFYGQLALERLGRPVPIPAVTAPPVALSSSQRAAFNDRAVVRAVRQLAQSGDWGDQSKFVRTIASQAQSAEDRQLAVDLARSLSRPDLGVMIGRRAATDGVAGFGGASFPRLSVPAGHESNWTMIHAIARQESQFDRAIVSRAGARGLMQLMPATAREVAGKVGVAYNPASLNDPQYNIQLGSTYFRQVLNYYGGSYPLAVAAYNAGMGNVNKWIKSNGDPRLPGGDIVKWIEQIPIFETRDYVQRVLENAVVYDLLNPQRGSAQQVEAAPLSRYLGKNRPG
jgi:soluble lytic murein transglycosylase